MIAVLLLEEDSILLAGRRSGTALLVQLLLALMMMLAVVKVLVLMLMVTGEGAQAAQAGRVGLGGGREGRLGIRVLGVLRGAVAVHQSVLGDVMGSGVELLRREGWRLLSGHGVDGRAHGLTMGVRDGGGTPALGLWNLNLGMA